MSSEAEEIAAQLTALCDRPGVEWERNYPKIYDLRLRLAAILAQQRGWRVSGTGFIPHTLARRGVRDMVYGRNGQLHPLWGSRPACPLFDHCVYMREADRPYRAAAVASNPYMGHPDDDAQLGALMLWAHRHDLRLEMPDFPSLWVPGSTRLVLILPTAAQE